MGLMVSNLLQDNHLHMPANKQKNVRMTDAQRGAIEAAVKALGMPVKQGFREAVLAGASIFLSLSQDGQRAWIGRARISPLGFDRGADLDRAADSALLKAEPQAGQGKGRQRLAASK